MKWGRSQAHLVSRLWSHQRYLVVTSPEQSPQSVQLPLKDPESNNERKKTKKGFQMRRIKNLNMHLTSKDQ